MRVFVTGATGFIGSAVVRELVDAGHEVVGLTRSDAGAAALTAVGAEAHHGTLEDLDSLGGGAAASDGVIHTAFIHDFSDYAAAAETDRRAIEAIGDTLAGSDRPLVVASGMAMRTPGRLATEEDAVDPNFPRASEQTALQLVTRGVRVSVLRLPPSVHGKGDHGFVPHLISTARAKGVSAYLGDGSNRWPAVHRLDAAQLFRLALENAPAGARLHAVGDEGVAVRDIAEAIGRHLRLPVNPIPVDQALEHFGFIGAVFAMDLAASSTLTQEQLDWHPVQPGLIDDLEKGHYFKD
ncbi:SDR family oxidoreductase [Mycobacterium branderi]|uniref:3-beta hydroxysteroid dehydrogenase n=1 Tax=Mycobacterium branderi TaxID=43348 RepID=A0A7I7W3B1_9MYCO|nr:SDR family oxidoreductase [Mycobacterium branderi]MCV7236029.1 SDR family oxidoreductase [Mycobacterium branderi]ORA32788.1 3-beta hydroxysteroid dehydrogenase [Mycobacterium branderi]BBZ12089.1 putative NAD-dependent epimerase/dehydratase [Mycobacterium branderi]